MSSISYTIDKIQYNDKGSHWYGLEVSDFLIPFTIPSEDDEDYEMIVTLTVGNEDRVLELDTHYSIDRTSLLRIDNKSLGLTQSDPLTIGLKAELASK